MLKTFIDARFVKIFVFFAMLITSAQEVLEDFDDYGAHHGVAVFAIFQLLKVISEFYEAAVIVKE